MGCAGFTILFVSTEILYYSPLDFYWVEKKGVPKAMFII